MNNFKLEIPTHINRILKALSAAGFQAFVVGGCVRDSLLGLPVNDWDVCTSATPEEVKRTLVGFKVIETGIAHGTVSAITDGNVCEITTFRYEGDYSDHRHPDTVSFTRDIKEDLARRDFTINAMAYSDEEGLIDLFDGISDLKKKTIRCVGNANDRFSEDALRIMRAIRFAATLSFSVEIETEGAIRELAHLLSHVANERICAELKRLLLGKNAAEIVSKFKSVFIFIFNGEISDLPGVISDNSSVSLSLAYMLCKWPCEVAVGALRNLKFDNATIADVSFLLENRDCELSLDKTQAKHLLSKHGRAQLDMLSNFLLKEKSLEYKKFISDLPIITLKDLAVNGGDLINFGIPAGRQISEILSALLSAVIEDRCKNEKNELLNFLK